VLDILQFHHLVSQQFQGPALPPIGSLATRQMNQLGFLVAFSETMQNPSLLALDFAWSPERGECAHREGSSAVKPSHQAKKFIWVSLGQSTFLPSSHR
jgi:hypothetical protein